MSAVNQYQTLADKCYKEGLELWQFVDCCDAIAGNKWRSDEFLHALGSFIRQKQLFSPCLKWNELEESNKWVLTLDPRQYWGTHQTGNFINVEQRSDRRAYMEAILRPTLDTIDQNSEKYPLVIDMYERAESRRPFDYIRAAMDVLQNNNKSCIVSTFTPTTGFEVAIVAN
jgi:hypothetical protein